MACAALMSAREHVRCCREILLRGRLGVQERLRSSKGNRQNPVRCVWGGGGGGVLLQPQHRGLWRFGTGQLAQNRVPEPEWSFRDNSTRFCMPYTIYMTRNLTLFAEVCRGPCSTNNFVIIHRLCVLRLHLSSLS